MTVLVASNVADAGLEALREAGHTVEKDAALAGDALAGALAEKRPAVLVVRSTRVTGAMMDADPSLELIVRAGAGYDTIDVDGASERGIFVANCPGQNADAVAELTMGLVVALDRRLPDNVIDARAGRWNKAAYADADGLKGKTFGIVGLGNIGEAVAERAKGFEMDGVAWSRSLTKEGAAARGLAHADSPEAVARFSDIVSVHVASTPETKHLADRAFFEEMSDGAFFVNTSRAAVVDEDALQWALDEKHLRAALDLVSDEPSEKEASGFEHPLMQHPRCYVTHHIGASTQQAQDATALEAARVIETFAETGQVPNVVNLAAPSEGAHQLTVRHRDEVGVLAGVLDEARKAGWNIQEMENLIFAGAGAAVAHIRFDGDPSDETVRDIERHDDVLAVSLLP
ncbi:MAG: hydroxyacid dehydrogenase [Bacteroidetes bacterium QH_8_67_23]|jgi:D-3-phosphoglycerate dehydrogenase|nr:MAG: hydroxyacid dehydrogenase [Bacteroidetes bacterium QH_8_67_23]